MYWCFFCGNLNVFNLKWLASEKKIVGKKSVNWIKCSLPNNNKKLINRFNTNLANYFGGIHLWKKYCELDRKAKVLKYLSFFHHNYSFSYVSERGFNSRSARRHRHFVFVNLVFHFFIQHYPIDKSVKSQPKYFSGSNGGRPCNLCLCGTAMPAVDCSTLL